MSALMAVLHLIVYYAIAVGIWGLALDKSPLIFGASGGILGVLIGTIFVAPVIASQKSVDRLKDTMFAAGALWGNIAIIIAILGLIAWGLRTIF